MVWQLLLAVALVSPTASSWPASSRSLDYARLRWLSSSGSTAAVRDERRHLVLVIDRRSTTVGLIALEDVLEELVGEIENDISGPLQARRA